MRMVGLTVAISAGCDGLGGAGMTGGRDQEKGLAGSSLGELQGQN